MSKTLFGLAITLVAAIISPGRAAASQPTKKLYVDVNHPHAQLAGSCSSPQVPCLRITDALARAREIRYEQMLEPGFSEETVRAIEIIITPGSYVGTFGDNTEGRLEEYPLLINVPRVTLRGATRLALDERGRPKRPLSDAAFAAAVLNDSNNTVLLMKEQEVRQANEYVILILPTTRLATGQRSGGAGVTIEGLSFNVGPGAGNGAVVAADRANGFTARGCAFASVGPLEMANSSGQIEGNLFYKGRVGAIFVRAPDASQPNEIVVRNNVAIQKENGGLYLSAAGFNGAVGINGISIYNLKRHAAEFQYEPFVMPAHTYANALVENNLFTGAGVGSPLLGYGVRIAGSDGQVSAPGTRGEMDVTLRRNELTNNRDGFTLDASFRHRSSSGTWKMDIRVYLEDNTVSANSRSSAAMSFTGIRTALAPTNPPTALGLFKYAQDSAFEITDPAGSVADMWVDHLVLDPLSGTPLNNTFIYNGSLVAPPKRSCGYPTLSPSFAPYAPTTPCAP